MCLAAVQEYNKELGQMSTAYSNFQHFCLSGQTVQPVGENVSIQGEFYIHLQYIYIYVVQLLCETGNVCSLFS